MRSQRARLVDDFLESADFRQMDYLARILDFNHIEHSWEAMWSAIASRSLPLGTIQGMNSPLLNKWYQFAQELLN